MADLVDELWTLYQRMLSTPQSKAALAAGLVPRLKFPEPDPGDDRVLVTLAWVSPYEPEEADRG